MQSTKFFLVGKNVLYANKKFSKFSSFQPVLSIHCLVMLDLKQGLSSHLIASLSRTIRALQSMWSSMYWTFEDHMFGSLFLHHTHRPQR